MAGIMIDDRGEMRDAVSALHRVVRGGPEHIERFRHEGREFVVLNASALESLLEHLQVLTPLANTRAFVEAADEDERGQTVDLTADALAELRALLEAGRAQEADIVLSTMEDKAAGNNPTGTPTNDRPDGPSIGPLGASMPKADRAHG